MEQPLAAFSTEPTEPAILTAAHRSGEISANFDTSNIITEGVKRNRVRKQAYAAELDAVSMNMISAFHSSFSALSGAASYYEGLPELIENRKSTSSQTSPSTRLHRDNMPPEPDGYRAMLKHPHAPGFLKAISIEIEKLKSMGTWLEVDYDHATTHNKKPIPTRWVFKYKFDDQGFLLKYRARLCARGDLQKITTDTYAATLAARIFRALMALVAAFDLETRQLDAINAFANSPIDEPTYCKMLEGFEAKSINAEHKLLLLRRALYGLKQSPALWYKSLSTTLIQLGLEPISGADCLFTNQHMLVFFFIDDIILIYSKKDREHVNNFKAQLLQTYEMRRLSKLEWFLGIHITRDRTNQRLWLSQASYIDKLINKFNVSPKRRIKTPLPLESTTRNTLKASPNDIYLYQQKVGSINFAATVTRPDAAHAASMLSEHLTNPSERHLQLAHRVLDYLACTKNYAIEFDAQIESPKTIFCPSSDASYADDPDTRRSTQGYVFTLYKGPIDWKATKQRTVTTSTTEAELLALTLAGRETIWWKRFFEAIDFDPGHHIAIQCDNTQTIRILSLENPRLATKLRHVDIYQHWLRQEVQNKRIAVKWTPSAETLADGFTKALSTERHSVFVRLLGMVNLSNQEATQVAAPEGGVSDRGITNFEIDHD